MVRDAGQIQGLPLSRRCVDDDVVDVSVVDGVAHGVGDDGDDVRGCRTGIVSRIASAN